MHRPASSKSDDAWLTTNARRVLPMRSSCVSPSAGAAPAVAASAVAASAVADSHDMVIALGYDTQNDVAFVPCRPRHVAQGLLATQADGEHFAGLHAFEPELGAHERHRADLAGDVERLVGTGHLGTEHGANYTRFDRRCRVRRDA